MLEGESFPTARREAVAASDILSFLLLLLCMHRWDIELNEKRRRRQALEASEFVAKAIRRSCAAMQTRANLNFNQKITHTKIIPGENAAQ